MEDTLEWVAQTTGVANEQLTDGCRSAPPIADLTVEIQSPVQQESMAAGEIELF